MDLPDSIQLRPTRPEDLDFVLGAENAPENACYISQWPRSRHLSAIASKDEAHLVVETQQAQPIGYVLIQHLNSPKRNLRLRRLVITEKGKGYGKQTVQLILRRAFITYGAHRLWLDVKPENHRAKAVYAQAGFVYAGKLPANNPDSIDSESMEIMAILPTRLGFFVPNSLGRES